MLASVFIAIVLVAVAQTQLIPPEYSPGDVYKRTDFDDVDDVLTDVLKAGSIRQKRRCAIGVANLGDTALTNPSWYMSSGSIFSSPPYTVSRAKTGLILFLNTKGSDSGTTGIMSYDIGDTDHKLVVYWTVPGKEGVRNIRFNVKVYPKDLATDISMFNQMVRYAGPSRATGWMEKNEYGIKVLGTISASSSAKFYISVDAEEFSAELKPDLYTDCGDNKMWIGNNCWQECETGFGFCWVRQRCDSKDDCAGPLRCYTNCRIKN